MERLLRKRHDTIYTTLNFKREESVGNPQPVQNHPTPKIMRYVIRLQRVLFSQKLSGSHLSTHYILQISNLSSSSKLSHSKEIQQQDQAETNVINSLFKEITEVLGAADVIPDKTPTGFSLLKEIQLGSNEVSEEVKTCTKGVRGNVEVNDVLEGKEALVALEDTQMGELREIDVSPVVHEITEIVRAENDSVSMEERLESLGFQFEPEIVEKVLKRCFKVPHLAYRFFNWVKTKDSFCHTTKVYNTMLCIAGEAKEFGVVDNLVEEMEKNTFKDMKTWTILISQYGKAKLTGKSLFCFEKMRKSGCEPDGKAYKIMIHSLCNAGKSEIAFEFYKEMVQQDMGLDFSLYKLLLNCMAKKGDIDAVRLVADDMTRVSQISERDIYLSMLKSFCVAGRIREALELIRDLNNKEIPIDYELFETLVKGLCRAGRVEDALEIVEIMNKRNFVDGKIYGIIISGHLRRKQLSKALDLFQSMKGYGHVPTTSTYTELMQHLFRLNEFQKGYELYDEMLERGIRPDSVAIMAVVAGHVRHNRVSEAWEVFKTMEEKGLTPTWKSYSIFIKELCKVSRTDEILKVLYEMQASNVFIHNEVFEWVLPCMEKRGEMSSIEKVKQMQRVTGGHAIEDEVSGNNIPGKQEINVESNHNQSNQGRMGCHLVKPLPKAYNEQDLQEICKILSSSGDWSIIQEALEKCAVQFTPELVVETLRNCSFHGNAALNFFSWVGMQPNYRHTTETYNMAMKIAGRGKDFKHMRSLFYKMRRNCYLITSDTWSIMILQYGRTGLTEIALKIFDEMKANGCKPTDSTYKYLIICLCRKKGRKVDEAIKIFQEMIRAGYIPDKELAESYLCCLCEVGKLLEAKRCTDTLCKVGFTIPLGYSLYIRALCRAGRLDEALSLMDEVGTERAALEKYTYGSLIHGLLRKGRLQEALAKIEAMKQAGINPTVHVYTSMIVHFFKEKQTEKALETFKTMQQEGCEPTIVTYLALIRGYMNIGKVGDAWDVFHQLKSKGPAPDFETYSTFISCLCKAGKSEEALQLISDMLDNGLAPSTVNFRTVFFGLNREGKQDLAETLMQQKWALIRKRRFLT